MATARAIPAPSDLGPLAAPTPQERLGAERIAPSEHFRRDHFPPPGLDAASWRLEIGGLVRSPLRLDLSALMALGQVTERVVLECAGHRRAEFDPCPSGVPWGVGAVAEGHWTGAPLASVLERAGVESGATAVVLCGADRGEVEPERVEPFGRAIPLAKALDASCLLAWGHEGELIEHERGGPVRAILPGWYATDSVKWVIRATVIEGEFGGFYEAEDYRWQGPGDRSGLRLGPLPVHALVTDPADDAVVPAGRLAVGGIAWGGAGNVAEVSVCVDGGPWQPARLGAERGRFARRFWTADASLERGRHEIAVRAGDATGAVQPDRPVANLRGYGNNSVHRVRITAV